jgi:hypothetical protein
LKGRSLSARFLKFGNVLPPSLALPRTRGRCYVGLAKSSILR